MVVAVESGKFEGATFVVGEEYIMESTFLAELFIPVWFNVVTELEEYLYLHALLFLIEFLDLAGLGGGGRKRLLVGHWLYVVLRTRGRCTLDRKDGRQIVRRLSGGNLRHYCIQEPALCDGGSMVVWVVWDVIGGSGWKRQRRHVAGHPGKPLPSTPRKNVWKQHSAARRLRLPIYGCCSEKNS